MKSKLIKRIVLDINGKEIELTPEQAQKLCTALMDLLGVSEKVKIVKEKEYIPQPYPYPVWPKRYPEWPRRFDDYITWTNNDSFGIGKCAAEYKANNETALIKL